MLLKLKENDSVILRNIVNHGLLSFVFLNTGHPEENIRKNSYAIIQE